MANSSLMMHGILESEKLYSELSLAIAATGILVYSGPQLGLKPSTDPSQHSESVRD